MSGRLAAWGERLHGPIAAVAFWLLATSPWIAMGRRIAASAGFLDYAHVALGCLTVLLGGLYLLGCCHTGRWRQYFPWLALQFGALAEDLRTLLRGRLPASEGGGLFAMLEGLALLALLATALSGCGWLLAQGTAAAIDWRACHAALAWSFAVLAGLHVLAVAAHLRDFT